MNKIEILKAGIRQRRLALEDEIKNLESIERFLKEKE
jgi:hypothetical protein